MFLKFTLEGFAEGTLGEGLKFFNLPGFYRSTVTQGYQSVKSCLEIPVQQTSGSEGSTECFFSIPQIQNIS